MNYVVVEFVAWRAGESRESGMEFFQGTPESVAMGLIQSTENALCEYPVASGGEDVEVLVEELAIGELTRWRVKGDPRPRYSATRVPEKARDGSGEAAA